MTDRLYYTDAYQVRFRARIVEHTGDRLYLDRTAFYPASGGQPHDTGTMNGIQVLEVADEGERVAHRMAAPVEGEQAECVIDWRRRFDHMQQHTGQHLLSAVFVELHGVQTLSFHLGAEASTIDLDVPALSMDQVRQAERRANGLVFENRPVSVSFDDRAAGLRKPSEREGTLRIVSIENYDRSACGGTHVRATGEIGPILVRKLDKIRGSVRVEFLCGGRAVARARADYDALQRVAQLFSAPVDEIPTLVAAHLEASRAADKLRRKLETDLARYRARELYEAAAPDPHGLRRYTLTLANGNLEDLRPLAQGFTTHARAVFLAVIQDPPALLLAASEDSGIDAGKVLKAAVTSAGGRGGGSARMAQGSLPHASLLAGVLPQLGGW